MKATPEQIADRMEWKDAALRLDILERRSADALADPDVNVCTVHVRVVPEVIAIGPEEAMGLGDPYVTWRRILPRIGRKEWQRSTATA